MYLKGELMNLSEPQKFNNEDDNFVMDEMLMTNLENASTQINNQGNELLGQMQDYVKKAANKVLQEASETIKNAEAGLENDNSKDNLTKLQEAVELQNLLRPRIEKALSIVAGDSSNE